MKKYILLSAVIAIASCTGNNKNNQGDSTALDSIGITADAALSIDSMHIERKDTLMEITCHLQFATGNSTAADSINASISQHVLEQGRNTDVPLAIRQYVQKTYDKHKPEIIEMHTQGGEYFADMVFSFEHQGWFLDDNPDSIITYAATSYVYTGGAHGYHSIRYLNFSRSTGHLFTLDQVLDLSRQKDIIQLIVQDLMQQFECNSIQQLEDQGFIGIREMSLTDNFYIGKHGITFVFNPYDIACYALGKQSVTLTYNQLKTYLKRLKGLSPKL